MHAIDSHSPVTAKSVRDRKYCRGDVAIAGTIRAIGGIKCTINVVDISMTGFRMECLTYLSDSQVIVLSIPGFQPLRAKIMWQTEWMYGCAFERPLHVAVYEHLVRSYPSLEAAPNASEGFIYGATAGLKWGRPL